MKKGGYLDLFLTFARSAASPLGRLRHAANTAERSEVENRGWATEEELLDYYAVGQCTPGTYCVNVTIPSKAIKRKRNFGRYLRPHWVL